MSFPKQLQQHAAVRVVFDHDMVSIRIPLRLLSGFSVHGRMRGWAR